MNLVYDAVWLIVWITSVGLRPEVVNFFFAPTLLYIIVDAVCLFHLARSYR